MCTGKSFGSGWPFSVGFAPIIRKKMPSPSPMGPSVFLIGSRQGNGAAWNPVIGGNGPPIQPPSRLLQSVAHNLPQDHRSHVLVLGPPQNSDGAGFAFPLSCGGSDLSSVLFNGRAESGTGDGASSHHRPSPQPEKACSLWGGTRTEWQPLRPSSCFF